MAVEITGFDDLDGFRERVESANGEVPVDELFPADFMQNYTEFESFEAFLDRSPWTVETQSDFETIPADELDAYVRERTGFDSWEIMLSVGGREYVLRHTD
jgi:hypothetical protein